VRRVTQNPQIATGIYTCVHHAGVAQLRDRPVHGKTLGNAAEVEAHAAHEPHPLGRQQFDIPPAAVAGCRQMIGMPRQETGALEGRCHRDVEQSVARSAQLLRAGQHLQVSSLTVTGRNHATRLMRDNSDNGS